MRSKNTIPFYKFNSFFLGVIIFFILISGSFYYFQNYKNQIIQKGNIDFAENRLNYLNNIYITFLKANRDNRGFRLYQIENSEKEYFIHKNETVSLLNNLKKESNFSKDSTLFYEIYNLILKRFEDLDSQIVRFNRDPTLKRSKKELQNIDSISNLLEQKHQELIAFWVQQSKIASKKYNRNIEKNDELFLLWVIATTFLSIIFILLYRKNIKSQLLQTFTEESLDIIRQKEQEFSTAFDFASIGMALVSLEGKWLRVNKSLCSLLEYTENELMNLSFQDITHPEDLKTDLDFVEKMIRKEIDNYQMEKRYFTKDGSLVWVLLSVSLVWENEKPKYFISQIQNITKRKKLQDQLNAQKVRLQQVIEGTNAGTWEWNVQTGETIFNEKWANMLGYSLAELEPTDINTWIKFAHPSDLEASNKNLQDCFENRSEVYECACRMKHKSGDWIWVMDRGKVMTWTADGKPEWMYGSHIEITKMKRLQESLELEKNKFTTIFNSTFQFIGFLNLDGTVIEANETALHFAGLQPTDVIGKKFWDCHWWQISEATQIQLKEAIEKAAKGESINYEVAVWDKDKKPVTILFNLKPLKDFEGNVISIIPEGTMIQDIIDYRNQLETKNEELKGFAAIAAHDLKEPLRMISQFMERLSKKYETQLDEIAQKYIHFAVDGAKRMDTLINDLLAYAEIGGVGEATFDEVDLNEVYNEAISLKAMLIEEKNAMVSKVELPFIWGHKTAMKLLFQNLIGNSLKYQLTGNRPRVEVGFKETNKNFILSFKDNGIGISKENQSKIFNLFTRLHTKNQYEGTGMGLATCKKIVNLHGGIIWVESSIGNGSIFYVSLPKK